MLTEHKPQMPIADHRKREIVTMEKPRSDGRYPERSIDCENALSVVLQNVIGDAKLAGWEQGECFDALERTLKTLRTAYSEEPGVHEAK